VGDEKSHSHLTPTWDSDVCHVRGAAAACEILQGLCIASIRGELLVTGGWESTSGGPEEPVACDLGELKVEHTWEPVCQMTGSCKPTKEVEGGMF
jgi:hypothetical protein